MEIPNEFKSGETARLIPVVADSKKEERATSIVLAAMAAVHEFGHSLLQAVEAPVRKSSTITCYTEVVFKNQPTGSKLRPDGVIIIRTRGEEWKAIVESKIGSATLEPEQIESYLELAKAVGANAVITISNQFAPRPTHHPVQIAKGKLKSIALFHWSWMFITTEAVLCSEHRGVSDSDQGLILRELIRYLSHSSSGVSSFTRMPAVWKDLCGSVQQGLQLTRNMPGVTDCAQSWRELVRYIALEMSVTVGRSVNVYLTRPEAVDTNVRLQNIVDQLLKTGVLSTSFEVPDAASRIIYSADLLRRTLTASMSLRAPKDRTQARACVTWLLNQLNKCSDEEVIIVASWPGRIPDTTASLAQLREDRNCILEGTSGHLPTEFEIRSVVDLGGRFRGAKTFVEDAVEHLPKFYRIVGQYLQAWVPPAPRVKDPTSVGNGESGNILQPQFPSSERQSAVQEFENATPNIEQSPGQTGGDDIQPESGTEDSSEIDP